jgi:hypothetical protein
LRGVVGNDHSLKIVFVEEAQDAKNIHCAYQTPSTPRRGVQHVVDGQTGFQTLHSQMSLSF